MVNKLMTATDAEITYLADAMIRYAEWQRRRLAEREKLKYQRRQSRRKKKERAS